MTGRASIAPVLTLFLLAPLVGEVFCAALKLSHFSEPFRVASVVLFYGSGAILIRETARRRGLGWPSIVLLACAYGLIEEAVALQTFFNPGALGLDLTYGRAWGVNWHWVTIFVVYHVVWSIVIPIALTELLFPSVRRQPWLGPKGYAATAALFALGAAAFCAIGRLSSGYNVPATHTAAAALVVIVLVLVALRLAPKTVAEIKADRKAPRLLTAGLFAFVIGFVWLFVLLSLAFVQPALPSALVIVIALCIATLAGAVMSRWAGRLTAMHQLALIFGAVMASSLYGLLIIKETGTVLDLAFHLCVVVATPILLVVLGRRIGNFVALANEEPQ